jgi:hypothetical protein
MGILDQLPEEYDYVDYRPTLATSLLGAGATIGTVLAARGLMKGFGKKTGKGLSGSKSKMKGSINLNKRPGKMGKKAKLGKKAKKGASAAAVAGPDDLPMYVRGDVLPAYKPALPPRPNLPPRVAGPAPGALARSGGYANLGPKMKGPQLKRQGGIANLNTNLGTPMPKPKAGLKRSGGMSDLRSTNEKRRATKNPFSDKNAITKPVVPPPPKNPFSDYYAVKKTKPKIPERNPFADYNAVKKTKPKVPAPPKNPFSDYYAVKRKGSKGKKK